MYNLILRELLLFSLTRWVPVVYWNWLTYIFGFHTNVQSNFEGTSTVQLKEVRSSCILKLTVICLGFIQMYNLILRERLLFNLRKWVLVLYQNWLLYIKFLKRPKSELEYMNVILLYSNHRLFWPLVTIFRMTETCRWLLYDKQTFIYSSVFVGFWIVAWHRLIKLKQLMPNLTCRCCTTTWWKTDILYNILMQFFWHVFNASNCWPQLRNAQLLVGVESHEFGVYAAPKISILM